MCLAFLPSRLHKLHDMNLIFKTKKKWNYYQYWPWAMHFRHRSEQACTAMLPRTDTLYKETNNFLICILMLLKQHGCMQPRPARNVVWVIRSQMQPQCVFWAFTPVLRAVRWLIRGLNRASDSQLTWLCSDRLLSCPHNPTHPALEVLHWLVSFILTRWRQRAPIISRYRLLCLSKITWSGICLLSFPTALV